MRTKDKTLMDNMINFINDYYNQNTKSPTMREIAKNFNVSPACVYKYVKDMKENGLLTNNGESRGIKTKTIQKVQSNVCQVAIVGSIACGTPLFAEENIDGYITLSKNVIGNGKHFILKANGDSMINAGISNGDYVVVRQQDSAEEGQIIVALIDNEATLKRYYLDKKRRKVRLHPENDNLQDMFFDNIKIQGVAVKVIKDLI